MTTLLFDVMSGSPDETIPPLARRIDGTNFQGVGYAFDTNVDRWLHFQFAIAGYTSGNLTLTLLWYPETATSGDILWSASIFATTPNSDDVNWIGDSYATAQTVLDTALGGSNSTRLHTCDITISNLDSLADADMVTMRVGRNGADGSDTMAGFGTLVGALKLVYS